MLCVCLARALGWMLLAVTRGFQTLLGFPPHLQGGGSRWAKPGDGESCAMTWESHLRELGCKEDFPVNFPSSGTGQCSFWLPPGPCSTSISSHITDLSRRCFLAHNGEWQPWRWRGTSRGAAKTILDGRWDPNHLGKAGDRQGETKGSPGRLLVQ